ncbi:MAG: hypothetical protein GW815_03265 [Candidatus Moranbacteria bacterium]|nr:hypothetical protein [Candidatus Moranbacteria bacterium]HCJ45868.1 hypothetical protein [Candidatus Moranbacteria bacterium]
MPKIKKGIILIAVVVVATAFVYYGYFLKVIQNWRDGDDDDIPVSGVTASESFVEVRKVSAEVSYMATEDKQDTLRFVLSLDENNVITHLTTLDAKTGEVPEKKKNFTEQASAMIVGKKLSALSQIDNVAKSSYTTQAFNSVIDKLKSQI